MKNRCYNPKATHFHRYGGRGITVCERWKNSFEQFLSDMGEAPFNHSIERIDNNGNYSPENCRWKPDHEQGWNQEKTIRVAFDGQVISLTYAAKLLGIDYKPAYYRLKKESLNVQRMIDAERAITFKSAGFYSWPH